MRDWTKFRDFISKEVEIEELGIKILGYFPYECARVQRGEGASPKIPRSFVRNFENLAQRFHVVHDNKVTVICEDMERFGTDNFAVFLHDCGARIGSWDSVVDYSGNPLK